MGKMIKEDEDPDYLDEEDVDSSDSEKEVEYMLDLTVDQNNESDSNLMPALEITSPKKMPELSVECLHHESSSARKDKSEKHITIKTEPPDSPSSSADMTNRGNGTLPPRTNWGGKHNFKLRLSYVVRRRTTDCASFSPLQNKFYISKDYVFRTLCNTRDVPPGTVIRATLYYLAPEFAFSAVKRCPMHYQEDLARGSPVAEHVMQSLYDRAIYEKNEQTGRCSVVVPYHEPQEPDQFTIYEYKLTCYSSCCGGINRRHMMIYFTLENNGVELGRQTLEVKICACPSRDLKQEEMKFIQSDVKKQKENVDAKIIPRPETVEPDRGSCQFTLTTDDPKLFKFLIRMKEFYETNNFIKYQLDLNKYLPS